MNMHINDLAAEIKRQKAQKKDYHRDTVGGFRMETGRQL